MTTLTHTPAKAGRHGHEEVESEYGYHSGYEGANPLNEQVARLKELCPQLGDNPTIGAWQGEVPNGSEGLFAIVNVWNKKPVLPGIYNDQTRLMLDKFKSSRYNKFF